MNNILKFLIVVFLTITMSACSLFVSKNSNTDIKRGGNATKYSKVHQISKDKADNLFLSAIDMVGTDYKYGGSSPQEGFDCSGLIHYLYKDTLNVSLPRTTKTIRYAGRAVTSRSKLLPGDIVFFNTRGRSYSHVGIYMGNDKFIHAPRTGKKVRIDNMNKKYWKTRFNGARRVISI